MGNQESSIATLAQLARNDTWNLYFVMLSEAKHLCEFLSFEILHSLTRVQNDKWLDSLEIRFSFFSLRGTGGLIAKQPSYPPKTPKPLARFFNVHYACICRTPQRCVYVIPFGSNIDVARCGWGLESVSNGKEMFRLRLNMTRFHVSLRASVTSVAINRAKHSRALDYLANARI